MKGQAQMVALKQWDWVKTLLAILTIAGIVHGATVHLTRAAIGVEVAYNTADIKELKTSVKTDHEIITRLDERLCNMTEILTEIKQILRTAQ
jgi:hypothetical protein